MKKSKNQQQQPPKDFNPTLSPEVEELVIRLASQAEQLRRTLWLTIQTRGGVAMIDESMMHELFRLRMERVETPADARDLRQTAKPILKITADILPEPDEETLKKLAALLLGTSDKPQPAMDKLGLAEYPERYILTKLIPYAVMFTDKWMAPDAASLMSQQMFKK